MRLSLQAQILFLACVGLFGPAAYAAESSNTNPLQCPPAPEKEANGSVGIPDAFKAQFPSGTQDRTLEQVQVAFNRNKGNIDAIYRRALREKPCLRGVMHFAIALRPDGMVVGMQVIRSTTGDSAYEQRIVERISKISFGPAGGGGNYVFTYPILFTSEP